MENGGVFKLWFYFIFKLVISLCQCMNTVLVFLIRLLSGSWSCFQNAFQKRLSVAPGLSPSRYWIIATGESFKRLALLCSICTFCALKFWVSHIIGFSWWYLFAKARLSILYQEKQTMLWLIHQNIYTWPQTNRHSFLLQSSMMRYFL